MVAAYQTTQGYGYVDPLTQQPRLPQIVANRNGVNNTVRQGNSNSRTDTQMMVRKRHSIGKSAVKDLQIGYNGYILVNGESVTANSATMEIGIEITSPMALTMPCFIAGAKVGTIPAEAQLILTDPLSGVDFPAGGTFFVRSNRTIASITNDLPATVSVISASGTGDGCWISPSGPSQVSATGTLSAPGGGGGTNIGGEAPVIILGIPASPMPAVIILGDSIAAGNNDTGNSTGYIGFIERGLELVGDYPMPWHCQTIGGHALSKARIDLAFRERAMWKYGTHLLCQLGTNDVAAGSSVATMQGIYTEIWTAAKRTIGPYGKPLQVAQSLILPRTTSNRRLSAIPTIASGGSGYAASSTFTVTLAGGVLKSGESAATVSVTTNGSGVVTTVNSIVNNGIYTTAPSSTNSPTGGAGTGLSLTCSFGGWFGRADQTPVAGFEVGGIADQINTWIRSQAGGPLLDKVIDHRVFLEDANSGVWVNNGTVNYATDDGIHMTPTGHILAQPAVTAWAFGIAP